MKKQMSFVKRLGVSLLVLFLVVDLVLIVFTTTTKNTALNPDFIEQEIENLHVYPAAKKMVVGNFASESEDKTFTKILNESITNEWVESQGHNLITNFFAYLKHEDEFSPTISTIELKDNLKANTRKFLPESPEFQEDPPENLTEFFEELDEKLDGTLPDEANLMEILMGMDQQTEGDKDSGFNELKNLLEEVRKIVDYFYIFSYLLIAVGAILILCIGLILRDTQPILGDIGASFVISGAISYGLCIGIISMVSAQIKNIGDTPPDLSEIIISGVSDALALAETYAVILLIIGLILLIFLFLICRQRKAIKSSAAEPKDTL